MGEKKHLRKIIEGIEKAQEKHREKIEEYEGKNEYAVPYWEREIKDLEKKKEELQKKIDED